MTIIGVIVFISGWIYAIVTYGFFLGAGLGWLPAFVIAWIADWLAVALFGLSVLSLGEFQKYRLGNEPSQVRRSSKKTTKEPSEKVGLAITSCIILLLILGAVTSS